MSGTCHQLGDGLPVLSIVIPVYNEGDNVRPTLAALHEHVPLQHEVLIAYDMDEDTTLPVVHELADDLHCLRPVKNAIVPGPSGALRSAFAAARAPLILVTMGDLCDDVAQIPTLLELVPARADIACPSRYCRGGRQELRSLKAWIPRSAGMLLRLLSGLPTYDPTNSYKLYSAATLRKLTLTSTVSFSVTLEIVAKAHCLGERIVELPTVWRDRQHGKSSFRIGASLLPYMKWFGLALLRNRAFAVPRPLLTRWISGPVTTAGIEGEPAPGTISGGA